ncbi:hypothetical protein DFS34DRAFT_597038 [Phlyctochytrium arcticum]|nr:hypothetical protein DFS34DRAFT_597038 [Phlyctochytrium arcticum]
MKSVKSISELEIGQLYMQMHGNMNNIWDEFDATILLSASASVSTASTSGRASGRASRTNNLKFRLVMLTHIAATGKLALIPFTIRQGHLLEDDPSFPANADVAKIRHFLNSYNPPVHYIHLMQYNWTFVPKHLCIFTDKASSLHLRMAEEEQSSRQSRNQTEESAYLADSGSDSDGEDDARPQTPAKELPAIPPSHAGEKRKHTPNPDNQAYKIQKRPDSNNVDQSNAEWIVSSYDKDGHWILPDDNWPVDDFFLLPSDRGTIYDVSGIKRWQESCAAELGKLGDP